MNDVNSRGTSVGSREAGFIGLETSMVLGIIAILIGLLFPHLQTIRENTNRTRTEANLKRLCAAALSLQQRTGQLPADLGAIWTSAGFPAAAGLSVDGASLHWPFAAHSSIIAEPLPGRTGSLTLQVKLSAGCAITTTPTPGADRERSKMFEDLLAAGASAAGKLLGGTDGGVWHDSAILPALAQVTTPDGRVSYLALQEATQMESRRFTLTGTNPDPAAVLNSFVEEAFAILQLGANGEQWATLPASVLPSTTFTGTNLFSLDGLATLTVRFIGVTDGTSNTILVGLLGYIDAARTDLRALASYIARIETAGDGSAGGSSGYTHMEEVMLISLAKMLY